ncbi:MAG TPA: AarF/UbiB family protein [Solirubrobacteraceae bacterium]|jgi:predicted unusual protein kinase regulating ubiquinone biosynthesis (AarF/ABC1/UbiB family)|nr:AarF/UbiB family protein [Solirubrobacteraceae bacterium]
MPADPLRRVDALLGVALRLARTAPSGRIVLAHLARVIDPAWITSDELAADLEASAARRREPVAPRAVERALRDAWGVKPTEELDDLELEPVAITPTSQVHRGIERGKPVAVKLLRPGIAASVRQDLVVLDGLASPLGTAFPALDPGALIREARERILDELDLEHEAEVQRRFHRALRGHPFLTVPAPVTRLAHHTVLVSDWVDGVPITRAPDPDLAAARLVTFVIGSARFGVVHVDPDPDDVRILSDGRLAILDFGATREVAAQRTERVHEALEAFADDDEHALGAALTELGALPAAEARTLIDVGRHALGVLAGPGPARLDTEEVVNLRARLLERSHELGRLVLAGAIAPEDLWPARATAQLFAVIARTGATGDWLALTRAALREGWNAGS